MEDSLSLSLIRFYSLSHSLSFSFSLSLARSLSLSLSPFLSLSLSSFFHTHTESQTHSLSSHRRTHARTHTLVRPTYNNQVCTISHFFEWAFTMRTAPRCCTVDVVLFFYLTLKKQITFYNCIVPMGFLPWEIRVAFPGES